MTDLTVRRNEKCVVNQPRCDYIFNSSRSCFIGYPFATSSLEVEILKNILEESGIEPVEAGGSITPGSSAFCQKICSKIITSQFCVIIINSEMKSDVRIPSANVFMEYGLMLGFNKHVVPFQLEEDSIPFNVSGLDTIKYSTKNFSTLAKEAIAHAISVTLPGEKTGPSIIDIITMFLLQKGAYLSSLADPGDKILYELGRPLNFSLGNSRTGLEYIYIGFFVNYDKNAIAWRVSTLADVLASRVQSLSTRVTLGQISEMALPALQSLFGSTKIWIIVRDESARSDLLDLITGINIPFAVEVFTTADVDEEYAKIPT